jgi:hypothetical protein
MPVAFRSRLVPSLCALALVAASIQDPAPTVRASSFQPGQDNEPERAVDGNAKTFWHSAWNPMAPLPQSLTIDYGKARTMASFVYRPRPGGGNGTVTGFDLSVSQDGAAFTRVVASGRWPAGARGQFVNFTPVEARYVRFEVTAGVGGFASAAEVLTLPEKLDALPPEPNRVSVLSPPYGAEIRGRTAIQIVAPGLTRAKATCWKQGDGFGQEAAVGTLDLDAQGKGTIDFPADEFPHGPLCVTISATGAGRKDNCYLQLFNQGGVSWREGRPKDPPAAAGMTLLFADDFDGPLSISGRDSRGTYYEHKPPDGSQDFSTLRFTGFSEPGNPFSQVGTYLRIRADEGKGSAGLISSLKFDGTGVTARAPCYFECRMIGPNATGAWPAFWLLTVQKGKDQPCDEIDIIEAYGGEGPGSPNAFDKYCVTPHAWAQGKPGQEAEKAALREIRAGKGSAGMDHSPQVVSMKNAGIPSTWFQAMHTYAARITETDTIYYCDDLEIGRHKSLEVSKKEPFYFMVNLATGGGWPVDLSRYNGIADMYVDYVRVYGGHPGDVERVKKPAAR